MRIHQNSWSKSAIFFSILNAFSFLCVRQYLPEQKVLFHTTPLPLHT